MTLFFWGMDPDSSLMCPQLPASAGVTVNTQAMRLQLNLTLCEMSSDTLASHSNPLDRCLVGPASLSDFFHKMNYSLSLSFSLMCLCVLYTYVSV